MRFRTPLPAALLFTLLLALGPVRARAGTVFSDAHLTESSISPNGDGVKEFTIIQYTIGVDSADVRILLTTPGGAQVVDTLQVFTRQGGARSRVFDGSVRSGPVADGSYEVRILGIGARGEGTEPVNLPLVVDRIAPVIDRLSLVSPLTPVVRNGDRITIQACTSGNPISVTADFSALDTGYDSTQVSSTPGDTGCRRFSYTVSPANGRADGSNLQVRVVAADAAGNRVVRSLAFCLSNAPPSIVSVKLLNQFPVFQNGDEILAEVRVSAVNPATVGGDFSNLDSGYGSGKVLSIPLGPDTYRVSYTISSGNTRPDGVYALRLRASDTNGCGVAIDTTLSVTLDNRGAVPALIDGVTVTPAAFSPNGDGAQDTATFGFIVLEDTVLVAITIPYQRKNASGALISDSYVLQLPRQFARGPHTVTWNGTFPSVDPATVPDQILTGVRVRAISYAQDRQRDVFLSLALDRTAPVFKNFRAPNAVRNGQVVSFSVVYDAPGYDLSVDLSALDSNFDPATSSVAVADSGNGAYGIRYAVSSDNTREDGNNKIVPVTAVDAAGNRTVTASLVRVCLSNQPPRLASASLVDNQGPFRNGETIQLLTAWTDGRWDSSHPLDVTADFSQVDTKFDPSKVIRKSQGAAGGQARFEFDYKIVSAPDQSGNSPPQEDIYATARDNAELGCGSTTAKALSVVLDNLVPLVPALSAPVSVTRSPTITLTVKPDPSDEDVILAVISRGTTVLDSVAATDGIFTDTVNLLGGENKFTAVVVDATGNASKPSKELDVFLVENDFLQIPGPFTPGDAFFLGLVEPARSVTLRIYDLDGVEVARLEGESGDSFHLQWNGLDSGGSLVSSGPYIAALQVQPEQGASFWVRKPFVFSRRTK